MSYLIKERMMRDQSSPRDSVRTADSAVAIENFSVKKKGRIEEPASFEAKMKNMEVAAYPHFPADNIAEVWLNIFEKLDAEDKITFSKTCHELHDWVASKRTCFHFSEVVPVLLTQTTDLPMMELLRCRTMCKSWTSDFNRVYPAHPSHLLLDTENDGVEENQITKLDNLFTSSVQMQRFLQEMYSHHGNPFPGRSIRLEVNVPFDLRWERKADRLRRIREYYGKAIELLKVYGIHVHMADFNLWDYGNITLEELEPVETYMYFRRWLLHLPNLKKLVVKGHHHLIYRNEDLAFYKQHTLPQLPHLEAVWMDRTAHAIWNGVLVSSCVPPNVKRLFLFPAPDHKENLRTPEVTYFPNLETFYLKWWNPEYLVQFLNVLEGVPFPPVCTVQLRLYSDSPNFGEIFRSLEVFSGSLTCLKLQASFTEETLRHTIATGFTVNLPHLERLELIDYNGPLDPFCQLPSLKFLRIEWLHVRKYDRSTVDFYGFEERMNESNVWEKIPSLQELSVKKSWYCGNGKTYHRDMLQLSSAEWFGMFCNGNGSKKLNKF